MTTDMTDKRVQDCVEGGGLRHAIRIKKYELALMTKEKK